MNQQSYCNNCGKNGHSYYQCRYPITSYGIVAFRKNPANSKYEYLMVRRKDTLGFVNFIRGKYSVYNKECILNMIQQMTTSEKLRILTENFSSLWTSLWGADVALLDASSSEQYSYEESSAHNKLEQLRFGVRARMESYNLAELVESVNTDWKEPEWGFPKGRRNYQERDYDCSVREFCEETGYSPSDLISLNNVMPFDEVFTGSNYKSYKHKYYVAFMSYNDTLDHRNIQISEIGASEWKTYEECIGSIRPYNVEKLRLIQSIHSMLSNNYIYPVFPTTSSATIDA